MVILDSQNIEKVGTGKGSLFKRHANIGMSRTNCKVDQATVRTVKHRRKTGKLEKCTGPNNAINLHFGIFDNSFCSHYLSCLSAFGFIDPDVSVFAFLLLFITMMLLLWKICSEGLASTAAYKRWEKAAIAGVSLVADAAEQLERVDTDKETECYQEAPGCRFFPES